MIQEKGTARLMHRLESKTALIGVVGLGYVGLPFVVEKAKVGFHVKGIERNAERVNAVNEARNYISDVKDDELKKYVEDGHIEAGSSFDIVSKLDVIVICVPTPLSTNLTPDLSYIESVTRSIAEHLRPGQLVTLESTTYPGTTDEIMRPILESSGLVQGEDFFLAHSPERVDPGNKRYTTKNTNKVVGASDPASLEVATHFYQQTIDHVVPVSSAKAAELTKVFENTYRAVNIALVNELTLLCDRMDIDVWEVLDAANTKPFGIMPFYPGPGVGGHCIPIDPHYLEWKAKEFNFNTRFIGLAGEINRQMPEYVVDKAARVLNAHSQSLRGSHILILGAAYKGDLADWRESPAIQVIENLLNVGAQVSYHDSFVPEIEVAGKRLESTPLNSDTLRSSDLVIITTAHSDVDYTQVVEKAKSVFDTRGVTRKLELSSSDRAKVSLL